MKQLPRRRRYWTRLREDDAVVPHLWRLEVVNVPFVGERRRRISEAQATRFVELLAQLPLRVDPTATDLTTMLSVGRRHALSVYDAAYLSLAEGHAAPLATKDTHLAAASRAAGVTTLPQPGRGRTQAVGS